MKWSLYLGRILGVKTYIHWTFVILLAWIVIINMRMGHTIDQTMWSVIFILTVFLCVLLHELGHATAARKYNFKTRDITLLPIGGLARLEAIPDNPKQELVVAIAGPLVNVMIAIVLYIGIILANGGIPEDLELSLISPQTFFYNLLFINILLVVFNMIPAFPMDGGRVLRALLSFKYEPHIATRIAASFGQFIAIFFVFAGLFYNPFLILIGIFVYLGAQAESDFAQTRSFLKGYTVNDVLMRHYYTLDKNANVTDAVKILLDSQAKDFLIMSDGKVEGTLNKSEIIKALAQHGPHIGVESVMNRNIRFLKPETSLDDVYKDIRTKHPSLMPVMQDEQVVGVLDAENIIEFVLIQDALEKRNSNGTKN